MNLTFFVRYGLTIMQWRSMKYYIPCGQPNPTGLNNITRRIKMNSVIRNLALSAVLGTVVSATAATVTIDPGANWIGYMNVFELPSNGHAYMFGSAWGTADLNASFSGAVLTLTPNTINPPTGLADAYWYKPDGTGNKEMNASMYVETSTLAGQTVTFTGNVLANTLVSPYTSTAFIKDFAPDYSSFNLITAPVVSGVFSISLATINDGGRHVQYGFETVGPDVWVTDVASKGFVQVTAVPEPASVALLGLGSLAVLGMRRRSLIS